MQRTRYLWTHAYYVRRRSQMTLSNQVPIFACLALIATFLVCWFFYSLAAMLGEVQVGLVEMVRRY